MKNRYVIYDEGVHEYVTEINIYHGVLSFGYDKDSDAIIFLTKAGAEMLIESLRQFDKYDLLISHLFKVQEWS